MAPMRKGERFRGVLTRRGIGVVFGKVHGSLEITAIVQGFGVEDDQADTPVEDVVVS